VSNTPCRQGGFSRSRIILDTVDGLASKPCRPGDLANACGFPQHRLSTLKLLAAVARLASLVGARVSIGLRVRDASALRFLGCFCLGLCGCSHEGDESVTDGALHGVLGRAVKRDAVDDGADDDAPPHELANGVAEVLVVAAKAVKPANDERVARPEEVDESVRYALVYPYGQGATPLPAISWFV
jgi:hypothetical protein